MLGIGAMGWLLLRTRDVMRLALRLALALWLGLSRGFGLACGFGARDVAPLRLPGTRIHVPIIGLAARRGSTAQLTLRLGHAYRDAKRHGHEPASE